MSIDADTEARRVTPVRIDADRVVVEAEVVANGEVLLKQQQRLALQVQLPTKSLRGMSGEELKGIGDVSLS